MFRALQETYRVPHLGAIEIVVAPLNRSPESQKGPWAQPVAVEAFGLHLLAPKGLKRVAIWQVPKELLPSPPGCYLIVEGDGFTFWRRFSGPLGDVYRDAIQERFSKKHLLRALEAAGVDTKVADAGLENAAKNLVAIDEESLMQRVMQADLEALKTCDTLSEACTLAWLYVARGNAAPSRLAITRHRYASETIYAIGARAEHEGWQYYTLRAYVSEGQFVWEGNVALAEAVARAEGPQGFIGRMLAEVGKPSAPREAAEPGTTGGGDNRKDIADPCNRVKDGNEKP